MEKNIQLMILISTLFLFCGCNSSTERSDSKINVDIKNYIIIDREDLSRETFFLSDIITDYSIVKLETNNNCLVGSVDKIVVQNDRIYILDKKTQSIFVFDIKGKFLFKIRYKGRGPFEYLAIYDFAVHKEIIVLDGQKKRLFFYNHDGKALEENVLPFYVDHLEVISDQLFAFTGSAREDRLIIWDRESKTIKAKYFAYSNKNSVRGLKPFDCYQNSVLYTRPFNDTILSINQDGVFKKVFIDYGEYKVTDSKLYIEPIFHTTEARPECMTGTRWFTETDSFIYFVFDYNELNPQSPYYVLFCKETGSNLIYANQSIIDDVLFGLYAPQIRSATKDGKFIFSVSSLEIVQSVKRMEDENLSKYKKQNIETFKILSAEVKETDNPLIIFYNFKKSMK